jgi:tetratricopeptide (TPR) repeat protein
MMMCIRMITLSAIWLLGNVPSLPPASLTGKPGKLPEGLMVCSWQADVSWSGPALWHAPSFSFLEGAKALVYQGYAREDRATWQRGVDQLQQQYQAAPEDAEGLYQLALAEYGLIGFDQAHDQSNGILTRIKQVQQRLAKLSTSGYRPAAVQAMQGGILGMQIQEEPLRAIGLGRESRRLLEGAIELDPQEPAAWIELGNLRYHAPGFFGGDMEAAVACFHKGLSLLDQAPTQRAHNWLYLHALAWLGQSYLAEDQPAQARATYQRALRHEPQFRWVKQDLLPALK